MLFAFKKKMLPLTLDNKRDYKKQIMFLLLRNIHSCYFSSTFKWNHRQPKRNMCGFGLQRSLGRIWSEYTRIISVLSDAK